MAVGRSKRKGQPGPARSDHPTVRDFGLIVCYDIADDDRRSDVSAVLSEVGVRVQLSVFECRVRGTAELQELLGRLRAVLEPAEDQVRVYNFGSRRPAPEILGQRILEEWRDFWILD